MIVCQISDLHLVPRGKLSYGVVDTGACLQRAVDHINRMVPAPDAVVATGDLADPGSPEAYGFLKELLEPLAPPVFLLPGNHDHVPSLVAAFPDHGYLKTDLRRNDHRFICYAVEDYPLRLVGLDTVTPGDHGGGLGPKRLSWLRRTLAARPHVPTLLFMHHPPFGSGLGEMDGDGFAGWREMGRIIKGHRQVEGIYCGHLHRTVFRKFFSIPAMTCPSTAMQLALALSQSDPPLFSLEPSAVMLHVRTDLWPRPSVVTHVSVIPTRPGEYAGPFPFVEPEEAE